MFKDAIKAFWDGKEIEFKTAGSTRGWIKVSGYPEWCLHNNYKAEEDKPEPVMYCQLKRKDKSGQVELTFSYYVIGSPVYETYKQIGWTECEHKTFEEIK